MYVRFSNASFKCFWLLQNLFGFRLLVLQMLFLNSNTFVHLKCLSGFGMALKIYELEIPLLLRNAFITLKLLYYSETSLLLLLLLLLLLWL